MNKKNIIASLIGKKYFPMKNQATSFAPANIALCKYWGKRDKELNLPITNSISISLGKKGTTTTVSLNNLNKDLVFLNDSPVDNTDNLYIRLVEFLDLFRLNDTYFTVHTYSNIPVGAGLASSASGFAALIKALNELFDWNLTLTELSILARIGSGSASRSFWDGFVEWQAGEKQEGLDSYSRHLPYFWPDLRIGLLVFSHCQKPISSREAMQITVATCPFYGIWPDLVKNTLIAMKAAIIAQDFINFGNLVENNALQMHALMLASNPSINYSSGATLLAIDKIKNLRQQGMQIYFTQDAGPNLKILFLQQQLDAVKEMFSNLEIVNPWENYKYNSISENIPEVNYG